MYLYFVIGHIIALIISIILVAFIFKEKINEQQELLLLSSLAVVLIVGGYLFEMTADNLSAAMMCLRLEFTGLFFVNTFLLMFVLRTCNVYLPKIVYYFFILGDAILSCFVYTTDYQSLFFKSVSFTNSGIYPHLVYEDGPMVHVALIYNLGFVIWQNIIVLRYYFKNRRKIRKDILLLVVAYVFPVLGVVYYFLPYRAEFTVLPFAMSVFLTFLVFVFAVFNYRLFDSMQLAKEDIIQNINEGYIVVDLNRNLLFANDIAYKIFPELKYGSKRTATINMVYRSNKKIMETGGKQYSVSVVPFYDKKTLKGYNLWLFDKTEEHEFTQRLIEVKEEAERANKAKTMFLANMSHEIRTPMNAIMGTVEMILREKISPEVEEHANSIKNAGMILLSIINDILDFSKIEAGKESSTDVEYNIGYLIKDVASQAEQKLKDKGVDFEIHCKNTIPSVLRGDETHVRQVISNILNNAVKYTKSGYVAMNVDWETQNGAAMIRVSVEDTGCGIAEDAIDTLFDSFQRADMIKNRTIEGTGLGLAIAKKLVESMGGKISVKSTYGQGSIFSFYFYQGIVDYTPMGNIEDIKENPDNTDDDNETFIAPMAKVLAVDDNSTNIKVIQGILTMYQIRVETAMSGMECLEKVENNHYHLILMDQMMPIMDGIETTKKIREMPNKEKRNTPIIALTANAIRGSREMFLENGFNDYISKPMDINLLERILKHYLPDEFIRYVDKSDPKIEIGGPISIPKVDVEKGMANYGNNRERYIQVLKYIYDDGEGQIVRMKKLLKEKKLEEYSFDAHALKGLTLGIGAIELSNLAKELEYDARDHKKEEVAKKHDKMVEEYRMLLANIKFTLQENNALADKKENVSDVILSESDKKERLREVLDCIELLDKIEAEKKLSEILSTNLDASDREILTKAEKKLNDFDYDEAKKYILKLL